MTHLRAERQIGQQIGQCEQRRGKLGITDKAQDRAS